MTSQSVSLTAGAAARLKALTAEEGRPVMLRVAVNGGGCSGFQYDLALVHAAEPEDVAIAYDGATALVDTISLPYLNGSIIDFVDELIGAQFKILNPNAKSSCGCGVSFSL